MTADLAEEHSTATLATERLEAEQADRLKLEKEKADLAVSTQNVKCVVDLAKSAFFSARLSSHLL